METLQMAFNILDITRKCVQLKCSKTTIYCWILNVGFSLKIYITSLYPIVLIISHLFIARQISTALYKLKSLSSLQGWRNWGLKKMTDTPNVTMNSKDKKLHLTKTSFHDSTPNWAKLSYMKLSPTFRRNQTKHNKLLIFGGDNWTFFFFTSVKIVQSVF